MLNVTIPDGWVTAERLADWPEVAVDGCEDTGASHPETGAVIFRPIPGATQRVGEFCLYAKAGNVSAEPVTPEPAATEPETPQP